MQTFLPYPDFVRSAAVLDDRRLGKQRVETLQILRALHLEGYGWSNHPAVTMWRGCTVALVTYGLAVVDEWCRRGYRDTTRPSIAEFVQPGLPREQRELGPEAPPWLGDEALHRSHRAALLRKDPVHYAEWFDDDPPADLPYVWPSPPAPPAPLGRRSAWVVRGTRSGGDIALPALVGEHPWVPLDARTGRRTKRLRQVARFVEEFEVGDLVVHPEGEELRRGRVAGPARHVDDAHVRAVRWDGTLPRTALRFPAALQDPQGVFVLRDEPVVEDRS